ncbi:hypothetical protein [Hydrogenimonas sp.]
MGEKLTRGRLLRLWWAWQWRTFVATLAGSMALIFLFAFFAALLGMPRPWITTVGNLIYLGVAIFASIHFFGLVLKKDFGDFRLEIVERHYCDEGRKETVEEEARLRREGQEG